MRKYCPHLASRGARSLRLLGTVDPAFGSVESKRGANGCFKPLEFPSIAGRHQRHPATPSICVENLGIQKLVGNTVLASSFHPPAGRDPANLQIGELHL